ncbi:hypothetical protein Acr_11g0009880 [Actinidia rufa]|uniref:Uncharacterized protein n=1 Tax=Actinidia rufa TaxID=165716 RepID=A0A7J0FDA8_9ERIC|nr:hypothetical protein Acr_11g0009880 [Actinidia rufa]
MVRLDLIASKPTTAVDPAEKVEGSSLSCQEHQARGEQSYCPLLRRRMEDKMKEMKQVLVVNNLKMPAHRVERHRNPLSRADSGVDLRHALNAKRGMEEGYQQAKLIAKAAVATRSIFPARSEAKISMSIQMEQLLPSRRYWELYNKIKEWLDELCSGQLQDRANSR